MAWLQARGVDVGELERRANEPWNKSYAEVFVYLADFEKQLEERERE